MGLIKNIKTKKLKQNLNNLSIIEILRQSSKRILKVEVNGKKHVIND